MSRVSALSFLSALGFLFVLVVEASVHDYAAEKFAARGNAFVVHGGSEGIYSSAPGSTDENTPLSPKGGSFIR